MRSTLDREMPARRRRRFSPGGGWACSCCPSRVRGHGGGCDARSHRRNNPKRPWRYPQYVRRLSTPGSESRPFAPEKNHAAKAEDRVSTDEQHADTESVNKSVSRTAAAGIREGASARNDEKTKGVTPNGIMTNDVMTNDATTVTVPANSKTPGDQLLLPIPGRIPVLGHSSELRLQTVPCAVRTPAVTKKQSSPPAGHSALPPAFNLTGFPD